MGTSLKPTRDAVDASPYLCGMFMEALRLFPPAPALGGYCYQDINITWEGKQYCLPKGANVQFLNYCMQRDPEYVGPGGDPDAVDPMRWSFPIDQQPHIGTFNRGAHACPGKPLSMLEAHVFLLSSVRDFEFILPEDLTDPSKEHLVEYEEDLLLRPKEKMRLFVRRRGKK
jgi:cytochrome P450